MEDGELEAPELDSLEYNIYVAEFETSGILKKFKVGLNVLSALLNSFID